MFVGSIAIAVLIVAWWTVRRESQRGAAPPPSTTDAAPHDASRLEHVVAFVSVVLLGAGPALSLLPWITGLEPGSYGDDLSHARVARDIALDGLDRGWIDSYLGGFPFAIHYPPLGGLLAAGLITVGLPPLGAVNCLGALATAATPIATFVALRPHVRPAHAAVGALFVAWIAPSNPFIGGLDGYFSAGLLSQVLATPLCIAAASGVAHAPHLRVSCVAAIAAGATHPQLTLAGLVIGVIAVVTSVSREAAARFLRVGLIAAAVMLALYGPGIATLRVPFGWGPDVNWLQIGFPPEALLRWVEGALIDRQRPPVATALLVASVFALLLLGRDARARAAAAGLSTSLAIAVSGGALLASGRAGAILLEVVQPLRALAWAPLAGGAAVALALHLTSGRLVPLLPRRAGSILALGSSIVVALVLTAIGLRERAQYVLDTRDYLASRRHACGPDTPPGYDSRTVRAWVNDMEGGAFWFSPDASDPANRCAAIDRLELDSPVHVATAGAVGGHVGVEWAAFNALAPTLPGSAGRAAALGVGHVLLVSDEATFPRGWRVSRVGATQLWSLEGASPLGPTCVRERWTGTNTAIRNELYAALADPAHADQVLSPDAAIELVIDDTPLRRESIDTPCEARANVRVTREESGYLAASVAAEIEVDVVLRVTATAAWTVRIDGDEVPWRMSAPGFLLVRVPAGTHELVAETSWPRGYFVGLALALLFALALTWAEPIAERLRRLRTPASSPSPTPTATQAAAPASEERPASTENDPPGS